MSSAWASAPWARPCARLFPAVRPLGWAMVALLGVLGTPPTGAWGQRIVSKLELDRREPKPILFRYVPADGGLVTLSYLSRNTTRHVGLFKYDENFQRQWTEEVLERDGRKDIDHLAVLGERILVFISERDRDTKRRLTYIHEYDLKGRKLSDWQQIHADDYPDKASGDWRFRRSLNRRKLLAFKFITLDDGRLRMEYLVMDRDTAGVREGGFDLDELEDNTQVKQVAVGNQGTVYALMRRTYRNRVRTPEDYDYVILKHAPTQATSPASQLAPTRIPILVEDRHITDLIFRPDLRGDLLVGGFYSYRNTYQIIGTVYLRISGETDEVVASHLQPLDTSFLALYLTQRQLERGKELSDFYLDDLVPRTDGGMVLLAEQYYVTSNTYADNFGMFYVREIYNYNDVALVSIGPDGRIEWTSFVAKEQAAESPNQLSYLRLVGAEQVFLLYKARFRGEGTNVYIQGVGFDGEVSPPKPFFDRFGMGDVFYRQSSEQIANDKAIIAYEQGRGGTLTIARIEF